MESFLGFTSATDIVNESCSYKLVPWLSWNEWDSIRESLFSSSPSSVDSALNRICAWRSRGCIPVAVDVTASIIEIQQKDDYFRADLTGDNLLSEELRAMMYCMAIMRLVNGVVEKTRKRNELSIAEAADAIGIPRKLIDIRHEGSHRDLPSLQLVRVASIEALNWLKSYYWEPQKEAIVYTEEGKARIRKKIKSKLLELAFLLTYKQSSKSSSSINKGQCVPSEHLYGRYKKFTLMAGKLHLSKSDGPKKQTNKTLKKLLQLYSSSSSEVASVLLELMLKASDSLDLLHLQKNSQDGPDLDNSQNIYDDWKHVITKFSNKDPELLLTLLKAVLDMIESHDAMIGGQHLTSMKNSSENYQINHLSYLFLRLVRNLKALKPSHRKGLMAETPDKPVLRAALVEILRKSLLISTYCNEQLMASAQILAEMTGNNYLIEKLNRLSSLGLQKTDDADGDFSILNFENLVQQENYLRQAAENLEQIKLQLAKHKKLKTNNDNVGSSSRWVVSTSWNPCPIGMLPCGHGSSGLLPVLDIYCKKVLEASETGETLEYNDPDKVLGSLEREMQGELRSCSRKREASFNVGVSNASSMKKMREPIESSQLDGQDVFSSEGVEGQLMVNGVFRKVGEEELHAIKSAIRILV